MRQIKRGVFVKKRQKSPLVQGGGVVRGRRAVPAVARRSPLSVGADSISARGVCAAAGCGGMRASRPTVVRVGGGRSFGPDIFGRFVGEGHAPPAGALRHREHPREGHGPPLRAGTDATAIRLARNTKFIRRGGIYPARGRLPLRGVRGTMQASSPTGVAVTRGRGFPVGRGICRAPFIRGQPPCAFIRSRRSRRSLRPGQGPRARGRGPGPGFRPP